MILDICDIINKHKGKSALVIGNGPSLTPEIKKNLHNLNPESIVTFGMNYWFEYYNKTPDYWIMADPGLTLPKVISEIKKFNIPVLYPDVVDLTPRKFIDENQITCLPFDRMHYNNQDRGENLPWYEKFKNWNDPIEHYCCQGFIKDRKSIQEEFGIYCNSDNIDFPFRKRKLLDFNAPLNETILRTYGPGRSVILHGLSFATMMGCDSIYVIGFDWDYTKGYSGQINTNDDYTLLSDPPNLLGFSDDVMEDLNIIKELAKNIGTNIYNLNKKSWHKILDFCDYDEFYNKIKV